MRFLADENFPGEAVTALRSAGHDILWVSETASGASDARVQELAVAGARILLTFDKDFGELAWRKGHSAVAGLFFSACRRRQRNRSARRCSLE
ncbi:DUF5615 family PIN-like protein [Methylocystis iwaonis]|uniref:DUF5615 family PIN-like protein n=1 Tax=Methylocystis iwaonis TaxID=2885079 RepID=UPI002E7B3B1D|nr:DUF5615 family PIN-like protein [Methylocystis iwaonis]